MAARFTNRQKAFIAYYLECWNATEAARKAGYSERTARFIGCENLTKPNIRQEIDRRLQALAISADEVLARLQSQATASMADFIAVDPDTGEPAIDMRRAQAAGQLHVLKRISIGDKGSLSIELYDAQAALVVLAKRYNLLTDRSMSLNVNLSELSDDQLERIAAGEDILRVLATPGQGGAGAAPADEDGQPMAG